MPESIRAEFNLTDFYAFSSFEEQMDYCKDKLQTICDRTKAHFAAELAAYYKGVDDEAKEQIDKTLAQYKIDNSAMSKARAILEAQVASKVAEIKAKYKKSYEAKVNTIDTFFSTQMNALTQNQATRLRLHNQNKGSTEKAYKESIDIADNFLKVRQDSLNNAKLAKVNATSIVNDKAKLIDSYEHPVLEVADGIYSEAAGTNLKIIGGTSLRLGSLKTSDLINSKSVKIQEATKSINDYKFAAFASEGKNYSAFKIHTANKFSSETPHYIIDSKKNPSPQEKNDAVYDKQGNAKIHNIAASGNNEELAVLLQNDPQSVNAVNASGYTPFLLAVQNGEMEAAKILISKGANVNSVLPNGLNALSIAILNANEELALYIVNNTKIDINNSNSNKQTALHCAIELKLVKIAERLVEKGAVINVARTFEDGYTALHLAAALGLNNVLEVMKRFIAVNKFDINIQTASGKTALHVAASSGQSGIVKLFIKYGANVNIQDEFGDTALMDALNNSNIGIAYILAGITSVNIINNSHQTASIIAAKMNQFNVADKLIERGEGPLMLDVSSYNYVYYLLLKGEFQRYVNLYKKLKFDINMSFDRGSSCLVP